MTPDFSVAQAFVTALTGSPDGVLRLRFVHDKERGRAGTEVEGTIRQMWPDVLEAQTAGFGVFYFMNEITAGEGHGKGGMAEDQDVSAIRVLAIDCDEGIPGLWAMHQTPALIVGTSAKEGVNRGQVLWRVHETVPVASFREYQRRLAAYYGTDRAVVNPSRVFRLPGSLHQKREPSLVTFVKHEQDGAPIPLTGVPELPPLPAPSPAVGEPVKLDQLKLVLSYITPKDRTGWRDLVAATRNTPAGEEEERYELLVEKVDPEWHGELRAIWETMPPKTGGVGFGTLFHMAADGGYTGGPEAPRRLASERFTAPAKPVIWRTFQETLLLTPPPLVEILPGFIEKGITTFLKGVGGVHKSRLAVQWGLAIDSGIPIWGRNVEQASFVYLSYEDSPWEVMRRIHAMRRKIPFTGPGRWADLTEDGMPLAIVGDDVVPTAYYDELGEYLDKIPGHKFMVLDSSYDVLRFVGNSKVNEGCVHDAIRFIDKFAVKTNSTIVNLWHPSQAGSERDDSSGWSVAWHNAPRAAVALERVKDTPGAFALRAVKRNNAPPMDAKDAIILHWQDGIIAPYSEATGEDQHSRLVEAIYLVACDLARTGSPVQHRGKLPDWAIKIIERDSQRRPTDREIKQILSQLQHEGRMFYAQSDRRLGTGYNPVPSEFVAS